MTEVRYRTRNVVLRVPGEDQVARVAQVLGWPRRGEIAADPDQGIPHEVQWAAGPGLTLHYLEDDFSGSCCLAVSGDHPRYAEAALTMAESMVGHHTPDELLAEVASALDVHSRGLALLRAGLAAPTDFDQRIFATITAGLRDTNPAVREAAIWATAYVPWPQYRTPLTRATMTDPDERVRDAATALLEAFDHADIG